MSDNYLERFLACEMPMYQRKLEALVRIPSISAEAEHASDCGRVVDAVENMLSSGLGFETRVIRTSGLPGLVATLKVDPSFPWVTVYNHLDVQPANEKNEDGTPAWRTNPFEPVIDDTKIIGRGATDDKGPMLSVLHAIKYLKKRSQLPVNVQIIYETEEEIGSKHFGELLQTAQDVLKRPDSILVSDTIFQGDDPTITYSLRGLLHARISVRTAEKVVHSGIGGGLVRNPLQILSHALGLCVDPLSGEVRIPGFYEDVVQITPEESEALRKAATPNLVDRMRRDLGFEATYNTANPVDALIRMWRRPTFEVHTIEGGEAGTKIPPYAKADVTMRLVAGQDPTKVLGYLRAHLSTIDPLLRITGREGTPAVMTSMDNPFMQKAAEACQTGFGREALYVGSGGTIGSLPEFQRLWQGVPLVMIAQSLLTDGYHAPNEEFRWEQARNGIKTMAAYLLSIGEMRT